MRILLLAHRMPYPPTTGQQVRAFHVARHLSASHELTLAFLSDDPRADAAIPALRRLIPALEHATISRRAQRLRALGRLAAGGSATIAYFDSPALRARLEAGLAKRAFDLVYVSSGFMAQYVSAARDVPVLLDFVDISSDKWLQYGARLPFSRAWLYRLEGARLREHEVAAARRANRCLVATPREQALLHAFAPWAPTTVVPNGVDLEYFTPPPAPETDSTLIFTGALDDFPNVDAVVDFVQTIFPRIRDRVPRARFLVVGKDPTRAVRRLAALRGVEVVGTVPDVRPYLRQAAVAVAPMRVAGGVQNKILEAMAMGLPVVATSKAHAGLEARSGQHLFVADDPATFADVVVRLLSPVELRAQVGRAARKFVEANHSWVAAMAKLDRVIAQVAATPDAFAPAEGDATRRRSMVGGDR